MSQENVEVARAMLEAWNAGDMDAWADFLAPDVISHPHEGWPEPGPFIGKEAVVRQFMQLRDTWDADALEVIGDFVDVGDRVAVRFIWRAVGQGPESSMESTVVFTGRKRRCIHLEFFWDHAEALEAVRLSEQDAHADT